MFRNKMTAFLLILFLMLSLATTVLAMTDEHTKILNQMSEQERKFLLMYFDEEDLFVVSTTRSLKSISRVAENVEVVTADDIELMGAHTLADVLNTVNGVQVQFFGASPGNVSAVQLQGSLYQHVTVLVDGNNINYIGGNTADVSLIPAGIIDKIEIIKGPASSAWGSSLGGVVNVITKSSPGQDGVTGLVSGSYGEKSTGDFRAELSGRRNKFGYYLYAGRLQSDGLRSLEDIEKTDLFTKLTYDHDSNTSASLSVLYTKDDWTNPFPDYYKKENLISSLSVNSRLSDALSLNISAKAASMKAACDGGSCWPYDLKDSKYGGTVKLNWKQGGHDIVVGMDYDFLSEYDKLDPTLGRINENVMAVFVNDTITIGRLTVVPGLRFDHINTNKDIFSADFFSPSLGLTYAVTDNTLLRGYVGRGFSLPGITSMTSSDQNFIQNPDQKMETVVSYQVGVETGALKYLWLKLTGFRHEIKDSIFYHPIDEDLGTWTFANMDDVRRQGIEAEIKTLSFYNFTLTAGATYIDSKDLGTGERFKDNPEYVYNIGLQYNDKKSFRALLKGHYISWNLTPGYGGKDKNFIFDINMIKSLYKSGPYNAEAFLTGHNIFNGAEYQIPDYKNAGRWIEAGIRFKF